MKPLTKSRFKLGLECPNKLYYTSKAKYVNNKQEDSFLKALAQGGFQVEELARLSYPSGIFVDAEHYDYKGALKITTDHFLQGEVVLFEAAFAHDNLFVRTDIVVKAGDKVQLIEVKAKSFDPSDSYCFVGKKGGIVASWKPYLYDLAYQKYVAQRNYPELTFTAKLMMADRTKTAKVDGLNQMFRVPVDGDPRKDIIKKAKCIDDIGDTVLTEVNVDDIINGIIYDQYRYFESMSFKETIMMFRDNYIGDKYINWPAGYSSCKKCEFKASDEQLADGLMSGYRECFSKQFGWGDREFSKPSIFEIGGAFRGEKVFADNRILMDELLEDDFKIKVEAGIISSSERQWIQVEKSVKQDLSIHALTDELRTEMSKWKYPLHFIDFETSAVALPFTQGRKPYEQVAFQFSIHTVYEDGSVDHSAEYINDAVGEFPNFHFARALKEALQKDDGSIFRYADHENTIVNAIISQLEASNECDQDELIEFLKSISHSTSSSTVKWCGDRDMIDLLAIVKRYYYNPLMKGSNSIKFVLPAVINSSEYLAKKYVNPIGAIDLTSRNFKSDHIWFQHDGNQFVNPYKLLPGLFDGWTADQLDSAISEMDSIADGGAALTAYSKLQFTEMSEEEREKLKVGLLKYCELDTLAMVMIFEHFREDL